MREPAPPARRARLSFKETRELEALPGRIAALEAEQKTIGERLADPALYRERAGEAGPLQARFDAIEGELLALLARWEALDAESR